MLRLRDILGQERAISQIRQAWQAERLPHGLIFSGPCGVGKGTAALALSAWFLCEKPGPDDACGRCPSCHLIDAGTHPDYHLIYRQLIRLTKKESKARDLSIDLVRDHLLDPASRKPLQGRGKVFVIEEAECMTRDAANSLLKTLEEPQGRTLIILLTDQLHSLLPTIRSRCQGVQFAALPADLVVRKLGEKGIDGAAAKVAAEIADGSLGLALRWAQDGLVALAGPLHERLAAIIAGRPTDGLPQFLGQCAAVQVEREEARDPNISKDQAKREAVVLYLRMTADYLRTRLPDLPAGAQLRVCRMIDDIALAQRYVEGNVNVDLVLEHIGNRVR